jgi:putative ABC transport system permease protein
MRISDYIQHSFSNLRKKKLRTFLTTFGVVIGIGALVSMLSFGQGIQNNITKSFEDLQLFHYITVFADSETRRGVHGNDPDDPHARTVEKKSSGPKRLLDDDLIEQIRSLPGVEMVFPEERFPAMIHYRRREQYSLIQVLSPKFCRSGFMQLRAGRLYLDQDPNAMIVSDRFLRRLNIKDPQEAIGQHIQISSLKLDFGILNPRKFLSVLRGERLPLSTETYDFTIIGVTQRMGFRGAMPLRSDVFIAPDSARNIQKISLTNIRDFFKAPDQSQGYSMLSIKVTSPEDVEAVQSQLDDWNLNSFALIDRLDEFKKGFLFLDMILFAIGMIAITVSLLGIVNTMVMSILERYKEIGIMKAVGATNRDVKKIFFFECGTIGFLGGVFGLLFGISVSLIINRIANHFAMQQGAPPMDYFYFPWWLCLGAVAFAILVSLLAGIYPTLRAARVDPVVALRHD